MRYSDLADLYQRDPQPRRRRLNLRRLVVLLALAAFAIGAGATTYALSVATASNARSHFASPSLYSPTGLSGNQSASTVVLNWTASNPNNGNGYAISAEDNGVGNVCPATAASYTTFVGGAAAGATTYTDSTSAMLLVTSAHYVCYLVQSAYDPAGVPPWASLPVWTSQTSLATIAVKITQITLVRASPEAGAGGGTSTTATLPANPTAGDLLVAEVITDVAYPGTPAGWTLAVQANGNAGRAGIYYRQNNPGGAGARSVTFSCPSCAIVIVQMSEYAAASTTAAKDQTGTTVDNANTNPFVVTAAATAVQGDLSITAITENTGVTHSVTAPWTHIFNDTVNGSVSDRRLVTPSGSSSESVTGGSAVQWVGVIATFKR